MCVSIRHFGSATSGRFISRFCKVPFRSKEELLLADTLDYREDMKENCPVNLYQEPILCEKLTSSLLMTEIQLKNIVDRMGANPDTKTDGDETTIKDGVRMSKFSKEAMEVGMDVKEGMKLKVFRVFDKNAAW
jgi:hypothetical protein